MNFDDTKDNNIRNHIYLKKLSTGMTRKIHSDAGETLTEVLVSILVISLGIILFLSVFLTSEKLLRQGEVQMTSYYSSRNRLEAGDSENKLTDNYILELKDSGRTSASNVYRSLASASYKIGQSTNYETGKYPITMYVNSKDSQKDIVYRYEDGKEVR